MRGAALLSNGLTLSSRRLGCNLNIPGPGSKKTARFGQALKYTGTLDMNSSAGSQCERGAALQAETMSELLSNSSLCSRPRDVNASKLKMNLCQTLSDPVGI